MIILSERATPPNPAAGTVILYLNTAGEMRLRKEDGTEDAFAGVETREWTGVFTANENRTSAAFSQSLLFDIPRAGLYTVEGSFMALWGDATQNLAMKFDTVSGSSSVAVVWTADGGEGTNHVNVSEQVEAISFPVKAGTSLATVRLSGYVHATTAGEVAFGFGSNDGVSQVTISRGSWVRLKLVD